MDLSATGQRHTLPAGIDLAAYRIVQEALTNVVKHAATDSARVNVHYRVDEVAIEITDDGQGRRAAGPHRGHGLPGMRERVHLYGGTFDAAPRPEAPYVAVWRSVRSGGDTKTRKSRRTLALPKRCVDVLIEQRRAQQEEQGDSWSERGLVFASAAGTELDAANVRRAFRRVVKHTSLDPQDWTPRELRHSFVSLLSDNGTPLEEISRLVRHSSTAVTELVYRKQIRPVLRGGATVMDRIFQM
ncbi:tyrosine-type recombinase/integrase [Acrocarpospora sp. B8E8]|uniref:tyrosine-type recombinase/integrase n=1 Tax=Acrocarpospora sp. B8E8 TaxID=3153572 RepID=UPI00325CFB80